MSTNPNFVTGKDEWTNYCQRCVPVYELRRRGIDIIAKPWPGEGDYLSGKGLFEIFDNAEVIDCRSGTGEREIEALMKEWGDGARAEIYVAWKGGDAHVFVAENVGGKIRYMCPQSGNMDYSDCFKRVKDKCTEICRLDTLTPSQLITECCESVVKEVNS